jgi:hypothetical protein
VLERVLDSAQCDLCFQGREAASPHAQTAEGFLIGFTGAWGIPRTMRTWQSPQNNAVAEAEMRYA